MFCRNFSNCGLNSHWLPYFFNCGYCDVPYTVVGRLENMEQDLAYIQQMAGFTFTKYDHNSGKMEKTNKSNGSKTDSLTKEFIDHLDEIQLHQLYKLFKVDFEMFGYGPIS